MMCIEIKETACRKNFFSWYAAHSLEFIYMGVMGYMLLPHTLGQGWPGQWASSPAGTLGSTVRLYGVRQEVGWGTGLWAVNPGGGWYFSQETPLCSPHEHNVTSSQHIGTYFMVKLLKSQEQKPWGERRATVRPVEALSCPVRPWGPTVVGGLGSCSSLRGA